MKKLKTALALLLALCMVLSLGGVTAWADIDVRADSGPESLTVKVGGQTVTFDESGQGSVDAVTMDSAGAITVADNVSGGAQGVYVHNTPDNPVIVTGNVTSYTGVRADEGTVNVTGSVEGKGSCGVNRNDNNKAAAQRKSAALFLHACY